MGSIWKLIRNHWMLFVVGQLAMLVAAASGLAFPWTVRNLFASVLDSGRMASLLVSVGVLGGVLVLRDIANYLKRRSLGRVSEGIVYTLRERIYDALLTRSLSFFKNRTSGDLTSAASNDIAAVQNGLTVVLTNLIQQAVILATVVTMLFFLDTALAAVVCLFLPPLILVSRHMGSRAARTTEKRQRILGEIMSIVQQSIAGIEVIRSYLLEGRAAELHRDTNDRSLKASVKSVEITAASAFWSGILGNLFLLTVMGFGGYRVITGHMTTPDLIAFILYSEMVTGPFVQLASLVPEVAKTGSAFSRIRSLLDAGAPDPIVRRSAAGLQVPTNPTVSEDPSRVRSGELTGDITYHSVGFSYDGEHRVLTDISFVASCGSTVALVGPSGAGKSTIIRLLPRLYEPDSGKITIGGTDIASIPVATLRSAIGVVSQEPFVFDLSVADNIRCGRPDASDEEVVEAARHAYADRFIAGLPHGYNTTVGDGGSRLSGGQRQRIAIARAFLKNPPILLLDEATSALDRRSETSVLDALARLKEGRTTLVIAHRFETIRDADEILVIDNGRIVERGTHRELGTRSGLYAELYEDAATRGGTRVRAS